jgi:catechol 2,3-dioxygenase-like lactoylglutathione lyase family enzyme
MRLEQIDHVALTCASPEATMDWYVRVLGFEHVFPGQWDGHPLFLRLGATFIALFPSRGGGRDLAVLRLDHLAFRAATYADFEHAQRELRDYGVSFAFQDHQVSHSIYFADPDGHKLEITKYDVVANDSKTKPA